MNCFFNSNKELQKLIREAIKPMLDSSIKEALNDTPKIKWLTTNQVMEILQCSRRHVQYLRDSGQLPYMKKNRTIRYKTEDVDSYLTNNIHKTEREKNEKI